jgi:hypothetical protein
MFWNRFEWGLQIRNSLYPRSSQTGENWDILIAQYFTINALHVDFQETNG